MKEINNKVTFKTKGIINLNNKHNLDLIQINSNHHHQIINSMVTNKYN